MLRSAAGKSMLMRKFGGGTDRCEPNYQVELPRECERVGRLAVDSPSFFPPFCVRRGLWVLREMQKGTLARLLVMGLAAIALVAGPALSQEPKPLDLWARLPAKSSGIVFIIDADVATFTLLSGEKKLLGEEKWIPGLPLVKQYRVSPGSYRVVLPGPFGSVNVNAVEGALTYVRLAPYRADSLSHAGTIGVQLTGWVGAVTDQVSSTLAAAAAKGVADAYVAPVIEVPGKVLLVSTEPPWTIPPPPPPK
jgi:hypothetical protein